MEPLCAALLELGIAGMQIQDSRDVEDLLANRGARWDYYDESLLKLRDAETTVTVYLPDNTQGAEALAALHAELARLKTLDARGEWGRLSCSLSGVKEEDWASNWKKYYHAAKIGERLVVCPAWERYDARPGETVVKLEPGMAFGTGTHETTRLCLRLLERAKPGGKRILDLGCGSGILAVAAVLLGGEAAHGIDLDETAVKTARGNAALNGVQNKCGFSQGDISQIDGKHGIIFANIVADVIISNVKKIASCLDEDGAFIASGIIDTREDDVLAALTAAGLRVAEREAENGWVALLSYCV